MIGNKNKSVKNNSKKCKPGKKPLSETEPTVRPTVNLPVSLLEKILAREKNISAYFRRLAQEDLARAI